MVLIAFRLKYLCIGVRKKFLNPRAYKGEGGGGGGGDSLSTDVLFFFSRGERGAPLRSQSCSAAYYFRSHARQPFEKIERLWTDQGSKCHSHKVFLEFFRDELSSPPAIFSNCAHIPYTHFHVRLVSIGCYNYEI